MAVLAAGVACLSPAPALAAPYGQRTLHRGDRGGDVKAMQGYLSRVGRTTPPTGYFGPMSQRSVRGWEKAAKRRADGRLTPGDARALKRAAVRAATGAAAAPAPAAVSAKGPGPGTSGGAGPTTLAPTTGKAELLNDGTAIAPADAPPAVQAVITAGNEIAKNPYVYGGGHNLAFRGPGYDCSGSVSYALHGGGLLASPRASSGFYSYGQAGPGQWITVYANGGHMYMVVAGLRFDTSGARPSRWQTAVRSGAAYRVRHPAGY